MPRNIHLHTEIYLNLKSIFDLFKMYMKRLDSFRYHHAIIEYRATSHSAVSTFTETVEVLERSLVSMLIRYCCSMIGCCWFFASCFEINFFWLNWINLDNLFFLNNKTFSLITYFNILHLPFLNIIGSQKHSYLQLSYISNKLK